MVSTWGRVARWIRGLLAGRPPTRATRSILAISGLVVLVVVVLLARFVNRPLGSCRAHEILQFAGSVADARQMLGTGGCDQVGRADFLESLGRDSFLLVAYGLGLFVLISQSQRGWNIERASRLAAKGRFLPIGALFADFVENILMRISLDGGPGVEFASDGWALSVLTIAWVKWVLVGASVAVAVTSMWAFMAQGAKKVSEAPAQPEPNFGGIGVSCSGGGIRSAGFTLGALESLEGAKVLDRTRWLSAVSGGAYAATGWKLLRAQGEAEAASKIISFLIGGVPKESRRILSVDPPEDDMSPEGLSTLVPSETASDIDPGRHRTREGRHRFLANGPGGLPRAILYGMGVVVFGIVVVAAFAIAGSWPLGRLIGSFAIIRNDTAFATGTLRLADRHWVPGLVLIGVAVVALAVSTLTPRVLSAAKASATVGFVLLALLAALPWAMVKIRLLFEGNAELSAFGLGGGAFAASVGFLARYVANPLARMAPRLGGFLLAVAVVLFGGKVATDAARGVTAGEPGFWADWRWWFVTTIGLLLFYGLVDIQRLSLRELYRSRLQRAFTFLVGEMPFPTSDQLRWDAGGFQTHPELVICAAVHHMGFASQGTPAETFTISSGEVRQGNRTVRTVDYLRVLEEPLERMTRVSSWMAVTGAAFSSAMGRNSLGSSNALMAALNIDLGIWLPNVTKVADGFGRFAKARLGYFMKEIGGLYDDQKDDYVFVADGGHWENLGIVELLRRRCESIVCLDASGDKPGSYATMRAAASLAVTVLDDDVSIGLAALAQNRSAYGDPAGSVVAQLPYVIWPREGNDPSDAIKGIIHYAKLQLTDDLPKEVRRFARTDRHYPDYSTANQLLDDQQFSYLVAAGQRAGRMLAQSLIARVPADLTKWQESAVASMWRERANAAIPAPP